MPNCNKYFNELSECLLASECVTVHHIKPSECLEKLLREKAMAKYSLAENDSSTGGGAKPIGDAAGFKRTSTTNNEAPVECALAHQSYVECKVSLMNPRYRFRGAYGAHTTTNKPSE